MIIDAHTHIGDILYPEGGKLIFKKHVEPWNEKDVIAIFEEGLCRETQTEEYDHDELTDMIARATQDRNFTATLENMRSSMDESGVTKTVCMPIPPHVTFDDLTAAATLDPDIIAFTGVDDTREDGIPSSFRDDVSKGAKGLKLHPIIQRMPLNSEKTSIAVQAFAQYKLPVLFHCGITSYYLGEEKGKNQTVEYGRIRDAEALVSAFSNVSFIAGHAGMDEVRETIKLLKHHGNVNVDISFQSPELIRELISSFGPERVLYASDWPFGNRMVAMKTVKEACRGDKSLEDMIFFKNAVRLLHLEDEI